VLRAQDAFESVPRTLGDAPGSGVVRLDQELDTLEPELVERPAREELHRAGCDPAAPGLPADEVSELGLGRKEVEGDDRGKAEHPAVVVDDGEAGTAPVLPAALVAANPAADERLVGIGRDACLSDDVVVVLDDREQGKRMPLRKWLELDQVIGERWIGLGER